MSNRENSRNFIDRVATETREYVQMLLDENRRLSHELAESEAGRQQARADADRYASELSARRERESSLAGRIADIEEQSGRLQARFAELEEHNTGLANLYVASHQLHGTLDREAVLAAIREIVINLIGSEELAIWELDDDYGNFALVSSFGLDESSWSVIHRGEGLIGRAVGSGEPFVHGASTTLPTGAERNLTAVIPLRLDDAVIGAIGIFRLLDQKNGLGTVDLELFDLLGSHAASALYCTRLRAREKELA